MTTTPPVKQWMSLPADIADALARYHAQRGLSTESATIRHLVRLGLDLLNEPPQCG